MTIHDADDAAVRAAMAGRDLQQAEAVQDEIPTVDALPQDDYKPKEFDPRHREKFRGLLYVGALTTDFEFWGHRFRIATPTQTERIQIGLVTRDYMDTISTEIAITTAFVSAFLVAVDDQPLPQPVVNNPKETALHERFRWVSENMRKPVIDAVYSRCLELEQEVDEVLGAMGKA
jgi:hypothetical protein